MIVLDSSAVIDFFLGDELGRKIKAAIGKESVGVTSITVIQQQCALITTDKDFNRVDDLKVVRV